MLSSPQALPLSISISSSLRLPSLSVLLRSTPPLSRIQSSSCFPGGSPTEVAKQPRSTAVNSSLSSAHSGSRSSSSAVCLPWHAPATRRSRRSNEESESSEGSDARWSAFTSLALLLFLSLSLSLLSLLLLSSSSSLLPPLLLSSSPSQHTPIRTSSIIPCASTISTPTPISISLPSLPLLSLAPAHPSPPPSINLPLSLSIPLSLSRSSSRFLPPPLLSVPPPSSPLLPFTHCHTPRPTLSSPSSPAPASTLEHSTAQSTESINSSTNSYTNSYTSSLPCLPLLSSGISICIFVCTPSSLLHPSLSPTSLPSRSLLSILSILSILSLLTVCKTSSTPSSHSLLLLSSSISLISRLINSSTKNPISSDKNAPSRNVFRSS
ncbi:unnamed protein product [Closterium sp. NIES-53]